MIRADILILCLLLLSGCAQVRPPSGGSKDEQPPTIVASLPAHESTSFPGREVVVEFSERIQLVSPYKNILISPPLTETPTIKLTGSQRLEIVFNETLKPNVTYTINLGEAIKDLTEGNLAVGAELVFSTGPVLDSLSIAGKVLDAFDLSSEEDIQVILMPAADTLTVLNSTPYYLTRSDKAGAFQFNNLGGGNYRLYALDDQNGNRIYDLPNEKIAFNVALVDPNDSSSITLKTFIAESPEQRVVDYAILPTWAVGIITSNVSDSIQLRTLNDLGSASGFIREHTPGSDTTLFWPADTTLLKGQKLLVSDGNQNLDTITFRPTKNMPFYASMRMMTGTDHDRFTIISDRPVSSIDTSAFYWVPDSLGKVGISSIDSVDLRTRTFTLSRRKSSAIRLLPGAVTTLYGSKNDTTVLRNTVLSPDQLGNLDLHITDLPGEHCIFQLLGQRDGIIRETSINGKSDISWRLITPGDYRIKVIIDSNNNGRWDTGNLLTGNQPEQVILDEIPFTIRAGWQLEMDWP
jgi:hypothetical protein